jgi:hypothetical protein
LRRHGRSNEIAVADDSKDANSRAICRDWLRSFGRRFGLKIAYVGREEKEAYVTKLSQEDIPHEIAHFALANELRVTGSPGANRNALLLHTIGEIFLSCDDDSICWMGDLRDGDQLVSLVPPGASFLHTCFVSSPTAAMASVPRASCDLFTAHEELLGRSLEELWSLRATSGENSAQPRGRAVVDLLEKKGRVLITISGVLGDSGFPNSAGWMLSQGELRNRFLRHCELNSGQEAGRYVVQGVSQPTISASPLVMTTTASGFDNRVLLPPFVPSGKGEDTLFGATAAKCYPDLYTGHVPLAVLHAPEDKKAYAPLSASVFNLTNLLMLVLAGCPITPDSSPEKRLNAIGRYLAECGYADAHDFQAFLVRLARQALVGWIERLEYLLKAFHGEPTSWAQQVRYWIDEFESKLSDAEAGIPVDMPGQLSQREGYRQTQQFILQFGSLLQWWPEIVCTARRLRATGHRIGQFLSCTPG